MRPFAPPGEPLGRATLSRRARENQTRWSNLGWASVPSPEDRHGFAFALNGDGSSRRRGRRSTAAGTPSFVIDRVANNVSWTAVLGLLVGLVELALLLSPAPA